MSIDREEFIKIIKNESAKETAKNFFKGVIRCVKAFNNGSKMITKK